MEQWGLALLFLLLQWGCLAAWACKGNHATRHQEMLLLSALFLQFFSALFFQPLVGQWLSWLAGWQILCGLWILLTILSIALMGICRRFSFQTYPLRQLFLKILSIFFFWLPEENLSCVQDRASAEVFSADREEIPTASELLKNALVLNDTSLDEICTHRSEMISLSLKDDPDKWREIILNNRHTFYPVYDEGNEDVVLVLDSRDFFRLPPGADRKTILSQTTEKPFFVSENTTADELLQRMKQRHTYFGVVLDEYGGTIGIVTLHDIIEELFGDLHEAEEARPADIVRLPKGLWRISGEADLEEVSRALGVPLQLDEFETFSGYILGSLGYIPEDGSQFETHIGPLSIQIKSIAGHRIRQTLVRVLCQDELKEETNHEQTPTNHS